MLYSKTTEYAIRILTYFSLYKEDYIRIPQLSCEANLPPAYVAKVCQKLVKKDFLDSKTGPLGGFKLKKRPQNISLIEILDAVEDCQTLKKCIMGLKNCSDKKPCPLHTLWTKTQEELNDKLTKTTLEELIPTMPQLKFRDFKRSKLKNI